MMLIATTAAAALFASAAFAGAPAAAAPVLPPMIVNVTAAADLPPQLVSRILAEADAIWRPSGVTFAWRHAARVVVPYARASETGPYVPNTLRLTIGDQRAPARGGMTPLGWIVFDDETAPAQEIYLSRANAEALLGESRGVVGIASQMPIAQRQLLMARALGRALAHELGHYLLASKVHTRGGLMKAALSAVELFDAEPSGLRIAPDQRRLVAARLRGEPLVASR